MPEKTENQEPEYLPEVIEQPSDKALDAIKMAEKRLEHIKKFINLALTVTNNNDWVMFEDRPYLQASGAQKVARLFGIGWKDIRKERLERTDSHGSYYIYSYTGKFFLAGHERESTEFIGQCSSRDKFFGIKGGEYKDAEEVDETNITKKAWTNLLNRGIKGILGLNNLTVEDLKNVGLTLNGASVHYRNGSKGGTSQSASTEDIKKKIKAACLYLGEGDKNKAAEYYHSHADFEGRDGLVKAPTIERLSPKHASTVYGKLKKTFSDLNIDIVIAFHEYESEVNGNGPTGSSKSS